MRTYRNQFPWWKLVENECEYLIKIGYEDTSWGNDISPSFELKINPKYRVWIDHPNPDARECGGDQYCVTKWVGDDNDSNLETVFSSYSFISLLRFLDRAR